jgi:hypothetical protein
MPAWILRCAIYLPLGIALLGVGLYEAGGTLIYWGLENRADGWVKRSPRCTEWQRTKGFADLRPGHDPTQPLELSCTEALTQRGSDYYVTAATGMRIRYRVYPSPLGPQAPQMLYVHGISAQLLHGTRFLRMAERLGFQLVVMELSNHGESDTNGKGAAYGCRESADVAAVVRDLAQRYPKRELLIYATSMGTMATLNAMPQFNVHPRLRGLVLENPIPALDQVLKQHPRRPRWFPDLLLDGAVTMAGWRAGYNFKRCAPAQIIPSATYPVWIPMAAQDELVAVSLAEKVYQLWPPHLPRKITVYPHGVHAAVWNGQPHAFERDLSQFWQQAQKFVDPKEHMLR